MLPDHSSPFGTYRPGRVAAALIGLAQRAPNNWFGVQCAHALRRGVLSFCEPPLDVTVGAVRLRAHLTDNYSEKKFVFTPWRYDRKELQLLTGALPPDGIFVDIGANVGIYSLIVAAHLGPAGRILAIEPNPPAFARLQFNLRATRAERKDWPYVITLPLGVSDVAGEVELHLAHRDLGGSSLLPAGRDGSRDVNCDHAAQSVRITCRPLLEILDEHGLAHIDALKIDIEGAEDAALVPFLTDAADARLPRLIVMENSQDRWTRDLPGSLGARGYRAALRTRLNTVYTRAHIESISRS